MQCPVDVLFPASSEWREAILTSEHAECRNGQPMIAFGEDEVYGPGDIQVTVNKSPASCNRTGMPRQQSRITFGVSDP
jgi:hypothetical protein